MKMSLEEAEALGVDLDYCVEQQLRFNTKFEYEIVSNGNNFDYYNRNSTTVPLI